MTSKHLRIANIAGIPINLDYSWFLIFFLLTWSLGASYFPSEFTGWPTWEYWVIGGIASLLLFVSVLLHELGHSALARHYHIPVKEITLFIFGGVSQIQEEPKNAWSEFWIAIAGPIVSLMLGLIFSGLAAVSASIPQLFAIFKYLGYINIILFAFNLIPGFPLDGGRVFRAILWGMSKDTHRSTLIAANTGRFIAYAFIALGLVMMLHNDFFNGIWMVFIGWFLESAAVAQVQQQKLQDILSRYAVRLAMTSHFNYLSSHTTLDVLADNHLLSSAKRAYVVQKNNVPIGLLTVHQLQRTPKSQWTTTTAEQVMIPLDKAKTVTSDDNLWTALSAMDRQGVNQLLVVDEGHVVGTLSREDVVSFLQHINLTGA